MDPTNPVLTKLHPSCHLTVKQRKFRILTHHFETGDILGLICNQPETLIPGKPYIADTHIDEPVTLDLLDTQQKEIYLQPSKFKLIYTQGQTLLQL